MKKDMILKCTVSRPDETNRYTVTAKMYDGTEFQIKVFVNECTMNEPFGTKDVVDGWLAVVQEGRQGDRVSITLPKPSEQFGHNVTVNNLSLMPRNVTIEMFNPQRIQGRPTVIVPEPPTEPVKKPRKPKKLSDETV